jgi:hypothetical protein
MTWLNELSKHGKMQAKERFSERELKPQPVYITVRHPDESTGEPGQRRLVHH